MTEAFDERALLLCVILLSGSALSGNVISNAALRKV